VTVVKMEIADRDIVRGLEKGLAVIEAFDESRPKLSLTDVARITGLTRAAARRSLLTLTKLGYARYDGKFFVLTPKILRLGYAYLSSTTLPLRIQPFLEEISAAVGESSSAAILEEMEVVYVARAATRRIMSIGLSVGSRLPAYCTSLGRALLAFQPAEALDDYFRKVDLVPLTPRTKRSQRDIRRALAEVQTLGYALVDQELELGLRSIAVPIFDNRGTAVAAINVSAQAARITLEDMVRKFLPHLKRAQEALRQII